jgi:hypothetical protein
MPELPEVEVTRQRITPVLVGRTLARVRTTRQSYFFITPPEKLRRALEGRTVKALVRRGKYLLAELDGGSQLLLHLGMTGQLFSSDVTSVRLLSAATRASLAPEEQRRFEPDAHTHLQLSFADAGPDVFFRDVRPVSRRRGSTSSVSMRWSCQARRYSSRRVAAVSRSRAFCSIKPRSPALATSTRTRRSSSLESARRGARARRRARSARASPPS